MPIDIRSGGSNESLSIQDTDEDDIHQAHEFLFGHGEAPVTIRRKIRTTGRQAIDVRQELPIRKT
ncbi:hypothetical protein DB459_26840 [Bradyrhizobium sp. WD16]|nr:hypothetical protein DB459_26840 [Bradyrhizobium sp. WD16]